jgi:hypothetical protein
MKKDILGVGHPRTGTGYTTKLLNQFNLDVGHEEMKTNGVVAWQFALPHDIFKNRNLPWMDFGNPGQFEFHHVIYNTRDPKTSIPSIIHTENISLNIRSQCFSIINKGITELEKAILSILVFDSRIQSNYPNHFQYRIEDQQQNLFNHLSKNFDLNLDWKLPSSKTNSRKHPTEIDWSDARDPYKKLINKYCKKYGYDPIYKF